MPTSNDKFFASTEAKRMFPTVLWRAELASSLHTRIKRRIFSDLDELRGNEPPVGPGRTWQSSRTLHHRETFRELVAVIEGAADCFLDYLKIKYRRILVTGCWININAPGATHGIHSHPNNFLSGIYYLKVPPGADTVNFCDPRHQTSILRPPVTELTADNADQIVIKVDDGTLLLFASWLAHSVDANQSDERRITLSFNLMFSSYAEELSKPMW